MVDPNNPAASVARQPAALRAWAAGMSDTDLAAAVGNFERAQCESGGIRRAQVNRFLGYLRREAKRRWYS